MLVRTRGQVVADSINWTPAAIQGVSTEFLEAKDWLPLYSDRMFDVREEMLEHKYAFLDKLLANNFSVKKI